METGSYHVVIYEDTNDMNYHIDNFFMYLGLDMARNIAVALVRSQIFCLVHGGIKHI